MSSEILNETLSPNKKIPSVKRCKGQSILEVIVAMAIFSLIGAAMATLVVGGFAGLEQGGEYTQAQALAQEGIEAVKSIQAGAWNEIIYSQRNVEISDEEWKFGEDAIETIGQFTRTITFNDVCRDGSNNITDCPGSYTDLHSKKASVGVSWEVRSGITNSVQRVAYLTNWDSRDWIQTNWIGGASSGSTCSPAASCTTYDSGTSVDHSSAGELKLALAPAGAWVNAGGTLVTQTNDSDFDAGTYTDTVRTGTGDNTSVILDQSAQWAEHINSGFISQDINDISIVSASDIWGAADSGKIIHYDGTSWTETIDFGGDDVFGIYMVSASDGWAVGQSGKLWHYIGTFWSEYTDTGNEKWKDIVCTSASNCWAVGDSGALAQYNGTSWTESTIPSSAHINGVYALSASDIWAAGASGRLWHYNGSAWFLHTDTGNETWNDIVCTFTSNCWVVGDSGALAQYNGTIWTESTISPTQNIENIYALSVSNIWAAGVKGNIWNYNGTTWALHTDTGNEDWNAIAFVSASSGWAAGNSGEIFEYGTTYDASGTFTSSVIDGGAGTNNWDSVFWTETLPSGGDITISTRSGNTATPDDSWSSWSSELTDETGSSISSPDSRYIQYRLTLTRPTDPNQTPQFDDITIIYNAPTGEHLRGIDPVTANDIWAVGNNEAIIHYNGTSWNSVSSPVSDDLYGIDMISVADGWAVGQSGKILHYNGTSWSEHTDTGGETWNAISMASSSVGFAVGNGSNNMAEYNGSTWTEFSGPVSQDINDIYMLSDGTGWAVGDSGKILYYNGTSWSEDSDQGTQDILGIHMVSATDGWAVGTSGKIWHYDGSSWSEYLDTGGDSWESVALADSNTGWAFGDANEAQKWDGTNWSSQSIPTTQTIYDVEAITTINAWAVGRNGTILHFSQEVLYETSGSAISSAFDMGDASPIQIIEWDETLPSGADIKFQIRAALTQAGLSGEPWSSYFNTSTGELISADYNGNRWVQYRVELSGDGTDTPVLQEVRINYK